jgi:L-fuculose-phosphate aldolase
MQLKEERAAVAAACRHIAQRGLVVGTAGNVSVRAGDLVAITATGIALSDITPEQVTVVDLDGNVVDGDLAPTSELQLHLSVMTSTGATAVAHAHAMASTAVSCTHSELPPIHYMAMSLGGPVRVAPYATFGSDQLAASVTAALTDRLAALMANHGSVAIGSTVAEAVERLELLEWLCELYSRARALGDVRVLSEDELTDVVRMAIARKYGQPHQAPRPEHG